MEKRMNSLQAYYTTACKHLSITSDKLISAQDYQRMIKEKHVKDIVDHFDVHRFGEPVVNFREGHYYLIDGQHRVSALIFMNGGEPVDVKCTVFYDMTYAEEAQYFAKQDDGHMRQTGYGRIFASKEGKDPAAIGFIAANHQLGLRVSDDDDFKGERIIDAATTLFQMFNKYGARTYFRVMRMILDTWNDDKNRPIGAMLVKSVFLFDKRYLGKYQEKLFRKKLSSTSPAAIISTAKTIAGDQKNNIVALLVGYYNTKLQTANRLQ